MWKGLKNMKKSKTQKTTNVAAKRKTNKPSQMEKVRAARAYFEGCGKIPDIEMYAFLSIFHPDLSHKDKLELIEDRDKAEHRRGDAKRIRATENSHRR
jgi:hypothetical protein